MADDTKQLLIKISATTELLRSQMIAAENSVANFERNTNARLAKVDSAFGRLGKGAGLLQAAFAGGVAGAVAGVVNILGQLPGALINATKAGLEFASSIGEAAQKVGVGTEFLQEFRFAVEQNGGTVEAADNALSKFSLTLGKAFGGGKEAGAAFSTLGLNLKDLAGASDSQRFEAVADAIARIPDPARQSAAAVAIFGKGAKEIIPTLIAGADAFRRQAAEARNYGLVLSDASIQNADKTADKIQALQRSLSSRIAGAVADNAAAIGTLANALINLGIQAVNAGARYARFRSIAALGAGGATGKAAAAQITSTSEGRQQLFSSINSAIRSGGSRLPGDEAVGIGRSTNGADRARNLANLQKQRADLIRIAIAYRKIDAAKASSKPAGLDDFDADLPASGGGGGSKRSGGRTGVRRSGGSGAGNIVRQIKVDAEAALPAIDAMRAAIKNLDIDLTASRNDPIYEKLGIDPFADMKRLVEEAADRYSQTLDDKLVQPAEDAARRTAEAFNRLSSSVIGSIRDLSSAIKDGDFLDILQSVADAFVAIASTGAFGSKLQQGVKASQNADGARALGGPVDAGKTYLIGERGRELFVPKVPGEIISNDNLRNGLRGGGLSVQVIKGDLFDVIVDRRAQAVAQPMVGAGMVQASQGAQVAMMRRGARRLA